MNSKQIACVILMMIIGFITYVAQIVHKKTAGMRTQASDAESAAQAADGERLIAESAASTIKFNSTDARRFLEAWTPPVERIQTQQEVEETIQACIRKTGILVMSQKFEPKNSSPLSLAPRMIKAAIVVRDEYAKTLNWLGELENRLPIARLSSCRITGAETGKNIQLELSMEVPLVNLTINPLEKKENKR